MAGTPYEKSPRLNATIQVGGRGIWRIGANDIEDFITEAYRRTAERIAAGELKDERESEPE